MTKVVKIIRIEKTRIIAGCDKSACEGCKSSVFCRGQNSEFEVLNPHDLKLEAGDDVIISMPAGRTVFASAMSLAFPLLCFFLGKTKTCHPDCQRKNQTSRDHTASAGTCPACTAAFLSFLHKTTSTHDTLFKGTHPGGFEPPLPPPEGGALSPELRVRMAAWCSIP